MILTYPLEWNAINRGFTSTHKGIDFYWSSSHGGKNVPIYACEDGEVVALVDGMGNTAPSRSYGNCINISHGDKVYSFYAHLLAGSLTVKLGDKVKRGQVIGRMGNSGNSTGNHLHWEIRVGGSSSAYVVDPVKYAYIDTSWQTVSEATAAKYTILYYTPTARVGTPVVRDENRNQIELSSTARFGRNAPNKSGDALGYMNTGIYNILATSSADGFTWFKVEEGLYFAYYPNSDVLLYAIDEKDKVIAAQEQQIAELNTRISTASPLLEQAVATLAG